MTSDRPDDGPCLVRCFAYRGMRGDNFQVYLNPPGDENGAEYYIWDRHLARYVGGGWILTTATYASSYPCEIVPLAPIDGWGAVA